MGVQYDPTAVVGGVAAFNGNVGIGITGPVAKLHVVESGAKTAVNYAAYLENSSTNANTDGVNKYGLFLSSTGTFTGDTGPETYNFGLYVDTTSGADNNYSAYFADNVGIGTTNPISFFSIGASSQFQVDSDGDIVKLKNLTYSWPSSHVTDGVLTNNGSGTLTWSDPVGTGGIGYWTRSGTNLSPFNSGDDIYLNSGELLGIDYDPSTFVGGVAAFNGNVGIGITGPTAMLHIGLGSTAVVGQKIELASGASANAFEINTNGESGGDLFLVQADGNVGIGTTDPFTDLELVGRYTFGETGSIKSQLFQTSNALFLTANNYYDSGWKTFDSGRGGGQIRIDNPSSANGFISFITHDAAASPTMSERMRITGDGNVGIGTTAPEATLEVIGTTTPTVGIYNTTNHGRLYIGNNNTTAGDSLGGYLYIGKFGAVPASGNPLGAVFFEAKTTDSQTHVAGFQSSVVTGSTSRSLMTGNFDIMTKPSGVNDPVIRIRINENGNVGIGTTDPGVKLSVTGGTSGYQALFGQDVTTGESTIFVGESVAGDKSLVIGYNHDDNYARLRINGDTSPKALTIANGGNIGIGTTSPLEELHVIGDVRATQIISSTGTTYYLYLDNGGTSLKMAGTADIEGGINVDGDISLDGGGTISSDTNDIVIDPGSGTVCIGASGTCADKVDAGTVDPPYTINGQKYATYMASMTGVKEETTGLIQTTDKVDGLGYRQVIDFKNLEEGSDLWLFSRTTELQKNIDNLVALLTPETNTRTWYEVDKQNLRLIIYSARPTTISYRLTAPRFDADQWNNTRDTAHSGFIINSDWNDLSLDENGDVIDQNSLANDAVQVTKPETYDGLLDKDYFESFVYQVVGQAGETIYEIGSLAKLVAGQIKAGFVETTNLLAENIAATNASFDNLITNNINANTKLVTPLVETDNLIAQTVETKMLKPTSNDDLIVQLDKTQRSNFKIQDEIGKNLFSVDPEGNASVSGELTAESLAADEITTTNLETANATISGELIAQTGRFSKIYADEIDGLEARIATLTSNNINNQYFFDDATPGQETDYQSLLADLETDLASASGIIDTINNQKLLAEGQDYLDVASINANSAIFNEFLAVLGQASIVNLEVTNALVVQDKMVITQASIGNTTDRLYIQPSGLGGIDLMAGKIIIDETGNVYINNNLYVAGTTQTQKLEAEQATVSGSLFASLLKPIEKDINIQLPTNASGAGELAVINSEGSKVASIDSSGAAQFNKLTIATAESISSGTLPQTEVTTNATTGQTVLPAMQTEITIKSSFVTDKSLIYITPESDTNNKTLYIKEKQTDQFTVAINQAIDADIKFNWWIIN